MGPNPRSSRYPIELQATRFTNHHNCAMIALLQQTPALHFFLNQYNADIHTSYVAIAGYLRYATITWCCIKRKSRDVAIYAITWCCVMRQSRDVALCDNHVMLRYATITWCCDTRQSGDVAICDNHVMLRHATITWCCDMRQSHDVALCHHVMLRYATITWCCVMRQSRDVATRDNHVMLRYSDNRGYDCNGLYIDAFASSDFFSTYELLILFFVRKSAL